VVSSGKERWHVAVGDGLATVTDGIAYVGQYNGTTFSALRA
jgi:hypothetical protein